MEKSGISIVKTTQALYVISCFSCHDFTCQNHLKLITDD
jgi:hypothetical protein